AHGIGPVHYLFDAELLGIRAAFAVGQRIAMKAGRDSLIDGWMRKQVAGHLLDRELIERHVPVERVNHPIAIAPCPRPKLILPEAVAIGEAGLVQPMPRPLFAVMRRTQQPLNEPFVTPRRIIRKESALL